MNTAHAHPIPTKTGNLHAVVADRLSFIARSARIPRNPYKKTGNLHTVVAGRLNFIAPRAMTFYFIASSTATAAVTVAPTMGLLPMPKKPIIYTWAGTELEPANWASECIRPMVSVMP